MSKGLCEVKSLLEPAPITCQGVVVVCSGIKSNGRVLDFTTLYQTRCEMVLDLKCVFLQMILLLTHCGPVRRPIIMNPIKQQKKIGLTNVTIWEKQLVSEKNRPILLLFYFLHRVKMLLSKFEANPDSSSSKMRFFFH